MIGQIKIKKDTRVELRAMVDHLNNEGLERIRKLVLLERFPIYDADFSGILWQMHSLEILCIRMSWYALCKYIENTTRDLNKQYEDCLTEHNRKAK